MSIVQFISDGSAVEFHVLSVDIFHRLKQAFAPSESDTVCCPDTFFSKTNAAPLHRATLSPAPARQPASRHPRWQLDGPLRK
jgi:hypothetical protein